MRFVSLESRHPGLEFEHILPDLDLYWMSHGHLSKLSRIRVFKEYAHLKDAYVGQFFGSKTSVLRAQNIILWYGPVPRPLGTSKDV